MSTTARVISPFRTVLAAGVSLVALTMSGHAQAGSQVLVSQTSLVTGTQSSVQEFTVTTPGTLSVNLQNLDWPDPLSSLNFTATTGNSVLADFSVQASDPFTMTLGPGTYFANTTGTAGGPLDLGLYSLSISFTPNAVPLPPSGRLLLGGLALGMALLFVQQRRVRWAAAATA
jgi:hypothetical protein